MKNLIILLLYLPFLIYSQNVSSYDELMRARERLNQDRLDLEDWYVKQSVEFYFIISFKEGVDIDNLVANLGGKDGLYSLFENDFCLPRKKTIKLTIKL